VLIPPSSGDAERLRGFFAEAGYTQETMLGKLGMAELPSRQLRNLPILLSLTQEPTPLNTLLRWFWIGISQDASDALGLLPSWFPELATKCKLLRNEGKQLAPQAMMVPMDGLLVASDHTSKLDSADPDLVLWPNPTSWLLSRFTVRRACGATLDVGTGTGIQALRAASHSETVTATDLNERALVFAAFNARLNGIENIEFLFGDGLEPVAGRKFDLIISNPPFFISPSSHYLFCDNPMDLDQLCRRLAQEATAHLNEGGYFQMLCEWAEIHGQPWQERVAEWFEGTGCDAWIMKGQTRDPSQYAKDRVREVVSSADRDAELYREYMAYYQERKVEAIHDGIMAVRRRSGKNWILVEEISHAPKEPFGDSVMMKFSARDFLESHSSDDQMLAMKPTLSPHARLEQVLQKASAGWKGTSLTLKLAKGFPFSLSVQPLVAEFLGNCDGNRGLGEVISELAPRVDAPAEQVRKECLAVVRTLIAHGYVLW